MPEVDGHSRGYYTKYKGIRQPEVDARFRGLKCFIKTIGLECLRIGHLFVAPFQHGKLVWEWENKINLTRHLYRELLKKAPDIDLINNIYQEIWTDAINASNYAEIWGETAVHPIQSN